MSSPDAENGYPVEDFIKTIKSDLDLGGVLRIYWKRRGNQSVARKRNGASEIEASTVNTIMREMNMTKPEAIVKQKTAIIEEMCHLKLEKDHTPELFVCVRKMVDKNLTPEEAGYIEQKIDKLRQACIIEAKSVIRDTSK